MKQLLVIVGMALAVFLGVTQLLPDERQGAVELQRTEGPRHAASQEGGASEPIDPRSISGKFVFTPHQRSVVLAGRETRYASAYSWCRSFKPTGADAYTLEDLRILFNSAPRTAADLQRLVTVDQELPGAELGAAMLALLERHSGLQAQRAVFMGGRDITDAERVVLSGGVVILLVDRDDATRLERLETEELTLTLEDGGVVRAATDHEVRITGTLGDLSGRGLELDRRAGHLVIRRDVKIDGLAVPGSSQAPIDVRADGPLTALLEDRPEGFLAAARPVSMTLERSVVVSQPSNELELRGNRLLLETRREPLRLHHMQLEGNALLVHAMARVHGELITYTAREQGPSHVEVSGAPVSIRLAEGARALPGAQGSGELLVETPSTLAFDIVPERPVAEPLLLKFGPGVTLSTRDARVDARTLELVLERQERAAPEGSGEEGSLLRPTRVVLAGDVRGRHPDGTFACGRLVYLKRPGAQGLAATETIELSDGPRVTWKLVGESLQPVDRATRLRALLHGNGTLEVAADERILLTRDPAATRPLLLEGRGNVQIIRRGAGRGARILGSLFARATEAVLQREDVRRAAATGRGGFRRVWRLHALEASGSVALAFGPDARGSGERLAWSRATSLARLVGTGRRRARLVLVQDGAREQTLDARQLEFMSLTRRLRASGDVEAHLQFPALDALRRGGTGRGRVATAVHTEHLEATLAATGASAATPIEHLLCRSGARIEQDAARLSCLFLEAELVRRQIEVKGLPLLLELRCAPEQFETFQARQALISWKEAGGAGRGSGIEGELLLREDVSAKLLLEPGELVFDLVTRAASSGRAAGGLEPMTIVTDRELFVSSSLALADGATTIQRGDPRQRGFRLAARRMALFLVPSRPGASGGRRKVARAVAQGRVAFLSSRLVANGEKMVFDATQRLITVEAGERPLKLRWDGQDFPPMPAYLLDVDRNRVQNVDPGRLREGLRR